MRIITGSQRGKKLETLEGREVRPTTDRVKEALFNVLQFRIEGRRILDLFAGSGQLALEALSRGARSAVLVENNREASQIIERNIAATSMQKEAEIFRGDFASFLETTTKEFDVAFIDPPYYEGLMENALVGTSKVMSRGGIIIAEHTEEEMPQQVGEFKLRKTYKYGKTSLTSYEHESFFD